MPPVPLMMPLKRKSPDRAHGEQARVQVDVAVDVEHGQRPRGLPRLRGAHVHVRVDGVGADGIDRTDAIGHEEGAAAHEVIAALEQNRAERAVGAEVVGDEQLRDQQRTDIGIGHWNEIFIAHVDAKRQLAFIAQQCIGG